MDITVLSSVDESTKADADEIRALIRAKGITMLNLMGGDGCGKTAFLEQLIPVLQRGLRCAVLEGDLTTTMDAERIAAVGVPVVQLQTGGSCHLEPSLVRDGLHKLPLDDLDLVIIENVGNLVCPAEFDIGEHARLAMLSLAEGADKPAKYPLLFTRADAVIFSKTDLRDRARFDEDAAIRHIHRVNPRVPIFKFTTEAPVAPAILNWVHERREMVVHTMA